MRLGFVVCRLGCGLPAAAWQVFNNRRTRRYDYILKGDESKRRAKAVHVEVIGLGDKNESEWLEFDTWPPPCVPTPFYLQPDKRMASGMPLTAHARTPRDFSLSYRYEPIKDPTPGVNVRAFHR